MTTLDRFEGIWRALSDPTRRRILDLLRRSKLTTGQLAEHFPKLSRFAVMKHLSVLVEAKLVIVTKIGRERWNAINAVPLQEVVRRWLDPMVAPTAQMLLNLADVVEGDTMSAKAVEMYEYVVEMTMDAKPAKVWKALTSDIGRWWPKEYFSTPKAKSFVMECALGGKVFEDWGNGHGATWGTVVVWNPNEKLILALEMFPGWGGPGRSYLTYELFTPSGALLAGVKPSQTNQGETTLVRLSDSGICAHAAKQADSLQSGWTELLKLCKAFVETS